MNPFHFSVAGLTLDRAMVETLAWTLLHFVWQGLVVAATLALLDSLLSRSRPQLRYLADCVAMVVMLASFIATFVVTSGKQGRVLGSHPTTRLKSSQPDALAAGSTLVDVARTREPH